MLISRTSFASLYCLLSVSFGRAAIIENVADVQSIQYDFIVVGGDIHVHY